MVNRKARSMNRNAGNRYRSCIFTANRYTMPMSTGTAAKAASLRRERNIRTPQATVASTGAATVSAMPERPWGIPAQLRPSRAQRLQAFTER